MGTLPEGSCNLVPVAAAAGRTQTEDMLHGAAAIEDSADLRSKAEGDVQAGHGPEAYSAAGTVPSQGALAASLTSCILARPLVGRSGSLRVEAGSVAEDSHNL